VTRLKAGDDASARSINNTRVFPHADRFSLLHTAVQIGAIYGEVWVQISCNSMVIVDLMDQSIASIVAFLDGLAPRIGGGRTGKLQILPSGEGVFMGGYK